MATIKIKPEYADKAFGFNNSNKPLGQRKDLHLLLQTAKFHNLKHILDMFEEVPSDEQLAEEKAKKSKRIKAKKPQSE